MDLMVLWAFLIIIVNTIMAFISFSKGWLIICILSICVGARHVGILASYIEYMKEEIEKEENEEK
jgi:hypothetical protein